MTLNAISQFSIRQRFLVLVGLGAIGFSVVAGVFYADKQVVDDEARSSQRYVGLALTAERAAGLGAQLRLAERTFVLSSDPAHVASVTSVVGEIRRRLDTMVERTSDETFAEPLQAARSAMQRYEQILGAVAQRAQTLSNLRTDAQSAAVNLASAIQTVRRDIEVGAGVDLSALMDLRDGGGLERIERVGLTARELGDRVMRGEARVPAFNRAVQQFAGMVVVDGLAVEHTERMRSAIDRFAQQIRAFAATRDIMDGEVDDLGAAFANYRDAQRTISEIAERRAVEANASLTARLSHTGEIILIAIAVTLVVVAVLGLIIGGATTNLVRRLTHAMEAIARGDLDTPIPFDRRKDDIGAMARALGVFQSNGRALAEAELDKERRAEEARAARRAMIVELQAEIGGVASAASNGDFSRRVTASFADPELTAIGESLNKLVATVESGLAETTGVLSALGAGDLTRRVSGDYRGAFDDLKTGVNQMADSLADVVGRIIAAVGGLKSATMEILDGTNDLADRTTQQAATIEETSAALEEFSSTVHATATRAVDASKRAEDAHGRAEHGGRVMAETKDAINRIDASSAKIGEVIGLIDDIAFQTNLLALNASVEAARAGDAGRGFAVVAGEVRRLAQRAAEASAEVKALVMAAQTEVRGGVKLVEQASASLNAIVSSVSDVSRLMSEIARDSGQQAESVSELAIAVRRMDEMTQANASLVEETSSALATTQGQAEGLEDTVAQFRLADQPWRRAA